MQLKIETSVLQEAIRVITRLAPPVSGTVTLSSDGKKVSMVSTSETNRCIVNMPADVSGKPTTFAIAITTLRDATKGRGTLSLVYDKTLCKISAGNYKCDLATVDAIEMDQVKEELGDPIKLSQEQAAWLKSAVSTVALKPTALLSTFMPVAVKLTSKGAFVACYDTNHMAFMNSKEVEGDMELKLPVETMSAVLDAFSKGAFKIQLSKANLYVTNALVKVVLALPQEEDNELKLEEIVGTARAATKADGTVVEVSKTAMLEFLDNARAVATKERSEIKVGAAKGKLRLEVVTANGSTKSVIPASCAIEAETKLDFEFLDEAVRKSSEQVVMKLVGDEFVAFKLKDATIIVSTNQE